eukprot:2026071-Pyramimonas_sp.AAC.1
MPAISRIPVGAAQPCMHLQDIFRTPASSAQLGVHPNWTPVRSAQSDPRIHPYGPSRTPVSSAQSGVHQQAPFYTLVSFAQPHIHPQAPACTPASSAQSGVHLQTPSSLIPDSSAQP